MTASTVSSTAITNKLAKDVTYNTVGTEGGKAVKYVGTVAVATTSIDEVGDLILLAEIPGQLRITSIKIFNDDLDVNATETLAWDIGLYKDPSVDGTSSTVVDADAYASAMVSFDDANLTGVECAFEARNINVMGQTVAADGAESEHNSPRYLGLAITTVSATPQAGDVSYIIEGILV